MAGLVVAGGQKPRGNGHPDTGGATLTERAGGRFDTRRVVILGVAGGKAVELAELLEVIERQRRLGVGFSCLSSFLIPVR